MIANTSSAEFFEKKYRQDVDPWRFAIDPYENSRYDTIVKSLGPIRYKSAFEPGCSVGVLTHRLAQLSDSVTATDFSEAAVQQARIRCASLNHVHIACAPFSTTVGVEGYDLVVLSEIGYYFQAAEWSNIASMLAHRLKPGTTVLASHWTGFSEDHTLSGNAVHETLCFNPGFRVEHSESHERFQLDKLVRR